MMDTEIQVFKSDVFGEIRTCQVKNQIMFVGSDVAKALGYSDACKAIRVHVDSDDKGVDEMATPGGTQKVTVINESGVYSLILSSKLPQAKAFKRWVTNEVLPALRRTGRYEMQPHQLRLLGAKAEYCDEVLKSVDCVTTTQVAKEMGMTGYELYRHLLMMRVLYWQSGQYMLYGDLARMGLAKSRTRGHQDCTGAWHTDHYIVWTEKGRKYLHELFGCDGEEVTA